ncbi:hypothetical protein L7F22_048569 [Adiantum nelumboides]|nr:hypothetical protein [Adiantum nelumboides]
MQGDWALPNWFLEGLPAFFLPLGGRQEFTTLSNNSFQDIRFLNLVNTWNHDHLPKPRIRDFGGAWKAALQSAFAVIPWQHRNEHRGKERTFNRDIRHQMNNHRTSPHAGVQRSLKISSHSYNLYSFLEHFFMETNSLCFPAALAWSNAIMPPLEKLPSKLLPTQLDKAGDASFEKEGFLEETVESVDISQIQLYEFSGQHSMVVEPKTGFQFPAELYPDPYSIQSAETGKQVFLLSVLPVFVWFLLVFAWLLYGVAVWMSDALGIVPNCQNSILEWFRAQNRMDGYKEEGSSSQDRQSNPTVHEVGKGSSQAEEGFPHAAFSITGTAIPGTLFGGMQSMVPNPMYAKIGLHPGFQGTQGQFGVSQGNLGMAGFSIPPVNMTPRHQHVTGQRVHMAPTGVLAGVGLRGLTIMKLKSIKIYAFGLYIRPDALKAQLSDKYGAVSSEELKHDPHFFADLLSHDVGMTVRLMVHYKALKMGMVRSAFDTSLRNRLKKIKGTEDDEGLETFASYFSQNLLLPRGTIIDFKWLPGGQFRTEIDGHPLGTIHSLDFCRAFFDQYIGDPPVSSKTKEEIGEKLSQILQTS